MTGNCDPEWDKDLPEVHVVPGWAPDPRPLALAQLSFPLIVLLSLPGLPFPAASVELDLASKLTVIHGPGNPREGTLEPP